MPIRRACASTSNRPLIRGILQTIQILKCYEDDDHDNDDHDDHDNDDHGHDYGYRDYEHDDDKYKDDGEDLDANICSRRMKFNFFWPPRQHFLLWWFNLYLSCIKRSSNRRNANSKLCLPSYDDHLWLKFDCLPSSVATDSRGCPIYAPK